jgi:hypothetical protein
MIIDERQGNKSIKQARIVPVVTSCSPTSFGNYYCKPDGKKTEAGIVSVKGGETLHRDMVSDLRGAMGGCSIRTNGRQSRTCVGGKR